MTSVSQLLSTPGKPSTRWEMESSPGPSSNPPISLNSTPESAQEKRNLRLFVLSSSRAWANANREVSSQSKHSSSTMLMSMRASPLKRTTISWI